MTDQKAMRTVGMTDWCFLMAAVYLSPRLSDWMGNTATIFYAVMAFLYWREEWKKSKPTIRSIPSWFGRGRP